MSNLLLIGADRGKLTTPSGSMLLSRRSLCGSAQAFIRCPAPYQPIASTPATESAKAKFWPAPRDGARFMRALVIEDDDSVAKLNRRLLEREGFAVDTAMTATDGRRRAHSVEYDLIVLDLGLPDGSGLDVLAVVRQRSVRTPVLIVSGANELNATVNALDAGADDYLHKPYQANELSARVRALMRRTQAAEPALLVCGNVTLNQIERTVLVGKEELILAAKEFALLEYFLMNQKRTLGRTELLEKVWRFDFDPGTNVVDVNVSRLRAKLAALGATCYIESQRGIGYFLSADSGDR